MPTTRPAHIRGRCASLTLRGRCEAPRRLSEIWPGGNVLRRASALLSIGLATAIGGCAVGPDYFPPPAAVSPVYKEIQGWKVAKPHDEIDRGAWWTVYNDDVLNGLMPQIDITNQNLAAAEATFRQSVALVREARAALFPVINLIYNPERFHEGAAVSGGNFPTSGVGTAPGGSATTGRAVTQTRVTLETTGTWDIDVWGKVRRNIESNAAGAEASAADLANVRLAAQSQLATAYFNLRAADSLQQLLNKTVAAFKKTQTITENAYKAGTVGRSDVLTAQTQVKNTEALAINVGVQRAQFEHAIAVLMGVPPAALTIPAKDLAKSVPIPPPDAPATLLERRPDVAAAERRIQVQSAQIGVIAAAYFPDITLNGVFGWVGSRAFPISVANEIWQIGATATEIVFDGGLRRAELTATEALYYQAMANYRQTVLTALQQVEDQLSTLRILAHQQQVQDEAVKLSREAVEIALNEYKAGTVSFTTVVTAQTTQLAAEQASLTILQNRHIASVALIQALGGGWDTTVLPDYEELRHWRSCISVRDAIFGDISPEMPPCL